MLTAAKQKLFKAALEIPTELKRFMGSSYPPFVTNQNAIPAITQNDVPVFMFHSVAADMFEAQLNFLKENRYQTLTLETFISFLDGDVQLKAPSVLLTFDDGDTSWYRVAYPLLKRYNFHAIGFVVPFYLHEQPVKCSGKGWLSWPEIVEMDKSEVFDIQSHTYYHDRVFTSPKLVDFFHPGFNYNPLNLDIPWIDDQGQYTNQLKWGTPIYRYASRFESNPRLNDDETIRQACTSWVEEQGGDLFFQNPGWRKDLTAFYREMTKRQTPEHRYETLDQQKSRIFKDLRMAKQTLEEKLNKRVEHLCYPWGAGSDLAVTISQEVGYKSNFWVTLNNRRSNKKGDNSYFISRLKDDYLFRLPGRGRKSLTKIFMEKLRRRTETLDLY